MPEGYKTTEVGVIPEDWDVQALSEMCVKIQDGTYFSPSLGGNDYLYITSKNIGRGALNIFNAERIDAIQHRAIYSRCDVRKGDLLLTKDGVNTGNAALNHLDEEFSLLFSIAFLRFDTKKYEPSYFLQQILSSDGQNRIKELMSGNAITRLTLEKIRRIQFSVPVIEEQRAIAQTLSDVDGLIAALDKLIAKKRNIKTATMQELLTGKKRLPGFGEGKGYKNTEVGVIPEDWEVKHLKNALKTTPQYGINAPAVPYRDNLPVYIRITDISESGYFTPEKLVSVNQENSDQYYLEEGDLVFARTGSVGKSYLYNPDDGELVFAVFLIRIRPDENILLPHYLAQYVKTKIYWNWVKLMSMRTVQPGINGNEYGQLLVPLPAIEEQRAIATILSDMDAEIAALEKRRAKIKAIKQGMMQELLTGKIRLIVPNHP